MVNNTALNALAFGPPKHEETLSPGKSEISRLTSLEFPGTRTLGIREISVLAAFVTIYLIVALALDLTPVSRILILAAGAAATAAIYRYFLNNAAQMALLSGCMLLAKMEREFQILADFIQSSLLPIEQLMDTGKSTTITPLPANKQRLYFMLVQIRSAMADRVKKIHESLEEPGMERLECCFNWARREITLHQSALAQSRTVIPLDTLESFTLALLSDLDPGAVCEEFLAQRQA